MPKAKKIAAKVLLSATSSRMLIWTTWAWIVMRRKALCSSFGQIKRKHYQGDRWESEYLPICDKWSDSSVPGLGRASGRGAGVDHRCRKFNRMPASYGDWSSKKKKKKKVSEMWSIAGAGVICVYLGCQRERKALRFFEKCLLNYLMITTKAGRIKLDHAHRSLAPLPGPAQRPRPVIIKLNNFTDK